MRATLFLAGFAGLLGATAQAADSTTVTIDDHTVTLPAFPPNVGSPSAPPIPTLTPGTLTPTTTLTLGLVSTGSSLKTATAASTASGGVPGQATPSLGGAPPTVSMAGAEKAAIIGGNAGTIMGAVMGVVGFGAAVAGML